MRLTLDTITLGVPQVTAARDFYAELLAPAGGNGDTVELPSGRLAFREIDALAADLGTARTGSGFRGYALGAIVPRPGEVDLLLQSAVRHGATVVKPAKKQLFGEFTAVFEAPDGAVWKLAAASAKDAGPVSSTPEPTETAVYLGVASPTSTKSFYEALGMSVEHDYGNKFIDFTVTAGSCRLGLLPRKGLAKDVGVAERGEGFGALALTHTAASPEEVDALLAAAAALGARTVAGAAGADRGDYAGYFTDPGGYHWRVVASH